MGNSAAPMRQPKRNEQQFELNKYYAVSRQAIVREGLSKESNFVKNLRPGSEILITAVQGNRARISRPCNGWISIVTSNGPLICHVAPTLIVFGVPENVSYDAFGSKCRKSFKVDSVRLTNARQPTDGRNLKKFVPTKTGFLTFRRKEHAEAALNRGLVFNSTILRLQWSKNYLNR